MGNTYSRFAPWAVLEPAKDSSANDASGYLTSTHVETAVPRNIFESMLMLERQRAERSRRPFVLMLLDAHLESGGGPGILRQTVDIILATKRETDLVGWYKEGAIIGVIFTEVNMNVNQSVTEMLHSKIETAIIKHLGTEKASRIFFSLHVFPENWEQEAVNQEAVARLCADLDSST